MPVIPTAVPTSTSVPPTLAPLPTFTPYPTYTPLPTPTSVPVVAGYFTVGSTKYEVLVTQGTPDKFTDTKWEYQFSSVYFANGLVTGWDNTGIDELKAKMTP
jgi:hypothetical protein